MALCIICDAEYPDRRAELGYSVCLDCSPLVTGGPSVFIADVSKSNGTVTSRSDAVCTLGGQSGRSDARYGKFMRLASTKGESRSNHRPPVKPH